MLESGPGLGDAPISHLARTQHDRIRLNVKNKLLVHHPSDQNPQDQIAGMNVSLEHRWPTDVTKSGNASDKIRQQQRFFFPRKSLQVD